MSTGVSLTLHTTARCSPKVQASLLQSSWRFLWSTITERQGFVAYHVVPEPWKVRVAEICERSGVRAHQEGAFSLFYFDSGDIDLSPWVELFSKWSDSLPLRSVDRERAFGEVPCRPRFPFLRPRQWVAEPFRWVHSMRTATMITAELGLGPYYGIDAWLRDAKARSLCDALGNLVRVWADLDVAFACDLRPGIA